jgi:hypothetical protein
MGRLVHKSMEALGDYLVVYNNVYLSNSGQEVSITQSLYEEDKLISKNNIIIETDDLKQILEKINVQNKAV